MENIIDKKLLGRALRNEIFGSITTFSVAMIAGKQLSDLELKQTVAEETAYISRCMNFVYNLKDREIKGEITEAEALLEISKGLQNDFYIL